ncbi:MAG: pilus assembly PilX N-terminal domain-containing protein [candidate division KSB1 bacterium]|nr:pilus assembly PilX N-terminal domain-containing protein [candidate division KSB1 bacterium]
MDVFFEGEFIDMSLGFWILLSIYIAWISFDAEAWKRVWKKLLKIRKPQKLTSLLNKDQGSALVTVLVMITILTLITGTIMTTVSLQTRFIKRDLHRTQALYLAEAGIYKALWYLSGHDGRDKYWRVSNHVLPLFDSLSCIISIEQWGGYLSLISLASCKKQTVSIRVLVGEEIPQSFDQAVIIGGGDYPLVVTGSNKIIGDVTVGAGGVKSGRIKGVGFSGSQLVEGDIHIQIPPQMPYFDASLLENAIGSYQARLRNAQGLQIFSSQVFGTEHPLNFKTNSLIFVHGDVVLQSETGIVEGPGTLVASGNIVVTDGVRLGRRILLISGKGIEVKGRVEVDEDILYAQSGILITGELQGSGQMFSPGHIYLAGRSVLTYPQWFIALEQLLILGNLLKKTFISNDFSPTPVAHTTFLSDKKHSKG